MGDKFSISRRRLLQAGAALGGAMLLPGVMQAAWAGGSDKPEQTRVRVGFIPLTDCAPLAIAAAKTGSPIAVGTDIDEPSARIANENAQINDAICEFYFADGLSDARIAQHAPYDLVFANILAAPLVFLAPEIGQALRSGGVAILSGLLRTQEERVLEAYLPLGFVVEQTIHHDAWTALQLRKK